MVSRTRTHDDDDGEVAQDGGSAPVDSDMRPCFIAYFFHIGHPCPGQLTPVKTRYPVI